MHGDRDAHLCAGEKRIINVRTIEYGYAVIRIEEDSLCMVVARVPNRRPVGRGHYIKISGSPWFLPHRFIGAAANHLPCVLSFYAHSA